MIFVNESGLHCTRKEPLKLLLLERLNERLLLNEGLLFAVRNVWLEVAESASVPLWLYLTLPPNSRRPASRFSLPFSQ